MQSKTQKYFYLLISTAMTHNKLVRDLYPSHITSQGKRCTFHQAIPDETHKHLLKTFFEDVKWFLNATDKDSKAEKLADLHEVIEHLVVHYDIQPEHIRMIKEKKRQELWSFDNKIILEEEITVLV